MKLNPICSKIILFFLEKYKKVTICLCIHRNSIDDHNQTQLFEKVCGMRSFDSQLNTDDESWDDSDILNSWANNLQNNLKIEYDSLNDLDGDDTAGNDDQMQTFSQWDMAAAKEKNAVNETGWATFTIDNFADFDQHFNAAFEVPPLATENEPVITYATSMTSTSGVGTIGDQMTRNIVNGGGCAIANGPPSFRHHNSLVNNGVDLFADFETHQSGSLFADLDANGLDAFDGLKHNDDNANVFNTNDIQNETEQLNLINSMIAATIATTIPTTTAADANGQMVGPVLLDDEENDKPPPIVPSIQDDNKEQRTVLPARTVDDTESTSAMLVHMNLFDSNRLKILFFLISVFQSLMLKS